MIIKIITKIFNRCYRLIKVMFLLKELNKEMKKNKLMFLILNFNINIKILELLI